MTKGIKFPGKDKDGKDNIEYYDVPDISPIKPAPEDYDRRVAELISEKYDDHAEKAFVNNRIGVWDGSVNDPLKIDEYNKEYFAYQEFRKKCKIQARLECGTK